MALPQPVSITKNNPYKICFVCLGNICRSPTAEGIFQHLVNEQELYPFFEVDSAGTSAYHIGEGANNKSQKVANKHGIKLHSKARKLKSIDLDYFDLLLAMDRENLANMHRLNSVTAKSPKIMLLREFDTLPENKEVPDPYYGGRDGFENVFTVIERSCHNLLTELENYIAL